jgi:fructose-1,6-bisphosphatase I
MNKQLISLSNFSTISGTEIKEIIANIASTAIKISKNINRGGLLDILGLTGDINVQGEEVKKLDMITNKAFMNSLKTCEPIAGYASEENDGIHDYGKSPKTAKYVFSTDPLDGSGNIDVNISIGTIFSISKRVSTNGQVTEKDFLQKGSAQVCAGYFLYGTSAMLVFTTGNGVNGFTLDPEKGEFYLSHPDIKIPERGKIYSINESYSEKWPPKLANYIRSLKKGEKDMDVHNAKYVGALVADFHRNMLDGGIYIYPATKKNPDGKLRLLYECNPLAFVAANAGGAATNGSDNILDIQPTKVHQRTPLFIGSKLDVELFKTIV